MNWRLFLRLLITMTTAMAVVGCGSAPTSTGPYYDANKPQVFLSGADVEQAKAVAMGSAVSKGWKVAKSSSNSLTLQRPANGAAAVVGQTEGDSAAPAPSLIEVQTDFFQRPQGVDVVMGAAAVANPGSEEVQRRDITDNSRDDLMWSLSNLQRAWEEGRYRVASATPPLSSPQAVLQDEGEDGSQQIAPQAQGGEERAPTAAVTQPVRETPRTVETRPTPPPAQGPAPVVDAGTTPTPSSAAPQSTLSQTQPTTPTGAPVTTQPLSTTTATAPSPAPADPASSMLVLKQPSSQGVWSYYAEHYAQTRGCVLSGEGAELVGKRGQQEIHRVHCEGSPTFLVKCNAGNCKGTR